MASFTMTGLPEAGPRQRVVALIVYCMVLLAIQYWVVEPHLPPSTIKGLWFYAGIASLLLGSRLLNPYFTPPGDAAVNAFERQQDGTRQATSGKSARVDGGPS